MMMKMTIMINTNDKEHYNGDHNKNDYYNDDDHHNDEDHHNDDKYHHGDDDDHHGDEDDRLWVPNRNISENTDTTRREKQIVRLCEWQHEQETVGRPSERRGTAQW